MDQLRKNTLITGGLIGGGLAIAGGLLIWWLTRPAGSTGDRPPIIVSNGSVRIQAQFDDQEVSRGTFEKDPSTQFVWFHKHPGIVPTRFKVIVDDSDCDDDQPLEATNLNVTYTDGGSQKTFTIGMKGGFLALTFSGFDPVVDKAYKLRIGAPGAGPKLDKVDLTNALISNTPFKTCTFPGPHASIEVRQRH